MVKVEKVGLAKIFHDLGLQNGLSRGKCCPGQFFPLFPQISEEVSGIIKMVENVGQANFFHHFRAVYSSSEIRGKVEKVGLATFSRLKSWKMSARPTFSTIFVIYKTSSEFCGKSGKSWPGQNFPRFGPPKRLESWKMLSRPIFSTFSTNF